MSHVVCVTDSNIWIDLDVAGLFPLLFGGSIEWVMTDFVLSEMGAYLDRIPAGAIRIRQMTEAEVAEIFELSGLYVKPSAVDLSGLVAARVDASTLVTGDGALRRAAQREGVEVHGTLWVIEVLVSTGSLTPAAAVDALNRLKAHPETRLPVDEIDGRIKLWQGH